MLALSLLMALSCDGTLFSNGRPSNDSLAGACDDYCTKRLECDDEVDIDDCRTNCDNVMEECNDDEVRDAIDDLDHCSVESCDDVVGCGFDQGVDCLFDW